jgi:hypothetical protein
MRKQKALFCVVLIAVAACAIYSALGWKFKTALFPLTVSIPLAILATVQLVWIVFGKEEGAEGAAMDIDFSIDVPPEVARRRVLNTFAWIAAFILLVYLLGFPPTVPLFIFFYLKFQSEVSWLNAIVTAAVTWGCFYLLFQSLVHIQFESGAVQTWLGI